MHGFQQPGKGIEFLRCPCGPARVFVQPVFGDGLLRGVEISLLLVVIKDTRGGVQVVWVADKRGACLVQKLAQAAGFFEQIEIVFH